MFEIGKRFGQLGGQVNAGTETISPPQDRQQPPELQGQMTAQNLLTF